MEATRTVKQLIVEQISEPKEVSSLIDKDGDVRRGMAAEVSDLRLGWKQMGPSFEDGAAAESYCNRGQVLKPINGYPNERIDPEFLRYKFFESAGVDMGIRENRMAKALFSLYQKYADEQTKEEFKDILDRYDRTLPVADPMELRTGEARRTFC